MTDVTLIQCTSSKRDGEHPARDLYDESAYFRDMRAWADARGDPWLILSAKHGLVHPDEELADYDERGISERQAEQIAMELNAQGYETVHVTAGRDYTEHLVPALESRGVGVVNHFAGERIGTRRSLLQEATKRLSHESL